MPVLKEHNRLSIIVTIIIYDFIIWNVYWWWKKQKRKTENHAASNRQLGISQIVICNSHGTIVSVVFDHSLEFRSKRTNLPLNRYADTSLPHVISNGNVVVVFYVPHMHYRSRQMPWSPHIVTPSKLYGLRWHANDVRVTARSSSSALLRSNWRQNGIFPKIIECNYLPSQ